MQSLPRSSETAKQRPISERTRSQRRRSAETNEQTAARLSARRDRDSAGTARTPKTTYVTQQTTQAASASTSDLSVPRAPSSESKSIFSRIALTSQRMTNDVKFT